MFNKIRIGDLVKAKFSSFGVDAIERIGIVLELPKHARDLYVVYRMGAKHVYFNHELTVINDIELLDTKRENEQNSK